MENNLRLAFGSASCKDKSFCTKPHVNKLCNGIQTRLNILKNRTHSQLLEYKEADEDEEWVENKLIQYAIYKEEIENNSLLFVVQGFIHTYKWPTYFSFKAIGHIAAEGIVVDSEGNITEAESDYLWGYR